MRKIISVVPRHLRFVLNGILMFVGLAPLHAQENAKIHGNLIYMMPYGYDARNYNRPGFGAGGSVVYPLSSTSDALAGVFGLEYVNLLSENYDSQDYLGGVVFPYSQQTNQGYARIYLGPEFGAHNKKALLQPYAGFDLALVVYWISTDVVVNDNSGNEVRQNKSSNTHAVFGFDLNMGADLQLWENFSIDGGVKYLKSFSVPQQLGEGSLTIYPQYFQVYLGVGVSFDVLKEKVDE